MLYLNSLRKIIGYKDGTSTSRVINMLSLTNISSFTLKEMNASVCLNDIRHHLIGGNSAVGCCSECRWVVFLTFAHAAKVIF